MAANGVLNEVWTTSRARLGMRGSIEVRFPDFRSVTSTFSSSLLKVPSITVSIGLKKLGSIKTAHALYRDNGPLSTLISTVIESNLINCHVKLILVTPLGSKTRKFGARFWFIYSNHR